ncbi:MAG: N-6 DNA methylase, partial [Clostridia bacterium]|nr:N-6 DNA methylase [Clostridia bacterium]
MCGIPYHVSDKYLEKLINADLSVAIFEDGNVTPAREEAAPEVVDELERAKELIKDFYAREYGDNDAQIDDLSKVPLAHTTTENEEFFVQVTVNLTEHKIEKYLGEDLIEVREYGSLKELNDNELSNLAFDELVVVEDAQIEEYKQKHDMVIPEMVEAPKPKPTLPVYNSHPEIPDSEKHNYRITDDALGVGGAKEKFKRNMAAINLLHELEFENRLATPEEQEILAQYTGWGGLSDAFDESKDNWASEFKELYATLSPEEYNAARDSTLTAFYTPPVVIRAMYEALEKMGLKRGNILEPSCGTGNFMGMLPDSMSESKIYGVELDSLTGRIARQLYQKNGITIDGYEKTHFPDSFFDVAVGNVPFGQFRVVDKKYDKHNFLIHDYFFAKTLDKVRPGGVIAFVTSSGTLDKENPAVRKYLAQRADLIGAIRLPDTTFKDNAGTRVVSDIIFLQKRDRIIEAEPDWVHLGKDENGITMNQYFIDNPDMVLGEMVMRSGPFGDEPTCRAYEGQDLGELLSGAIANINAEIQEVEMDELTDEESKAIPADPRVKNFSYTLVDGKVYYRQNSVMNPVETSVT